ncbi:MAG: DUF5063 domain-containing protein [Bacteroidetes bacterium]|nr:DUF5063 domain-containing protein [Bacteroidota bacterium]
MQEDTQLIDRHLVEMLTLAGEYCINIENTENADPIELKSFLSKISPMLYLRGILFPLTEEPEEEAAERFVTQEQWENVFNSLRNKFGKEDLFNFLDYSSPSQDEILKGSLAELYADVYQDMKDFVYLMTKNTVLARKYASYDVKQLFINNWGPKLLLAQTMLHQIVNKQQEKEDLSFID